ncbi:MAG: hypothetical protein B7Z73_12455 [Planctomycetia bacterium 21-64-5]|nr:MAG: hypothetical protein B7Z73_12455 [Planctomycetia bacterium 21-64-5]
MTPLGSEGADGPPALDGPPSAPEPPKPSVPLASAESVDLLKQVDMARDHVNGNWKRDAEALVSPRLLVAKIELPFAPSGDYELTIVAERLSGNDSFIVGLVIDGRQVAMTLDGYGGETAGLADLDHHDGAENATTRRGRLLPPGKPHTVVCTVRGSSLRVTCDGEPVIAWSGDAARLSDSDFWQVHDKRRLYLGAWDSEFKYTRIELKPLSSAKATGVERRMSDLAGDNTNGNQSRLPVPGEDEQKKSRQELLKKLAAAKAPEQKRTLAQEFVAQALAATKVDATAYVRLRQAVDLADAGGDLDLAWQAIDRLAKTFDVDAQDLRQKSLTEIGKTAKSPEQCRELVDASCRLMASALADAKPEIVKKAAAQAQSWAKRAKDKTLQRELASRVSGATKVAGELDAVAAARQTLTTMPDDPHANFVVGHFELCVADDWEPALVKLAKGDDAAWRKLASESRPLVHDLSGTDLRMAAADAWWTEAEKEPWPGRHYLRLHAANWYRLALPSLSGTNRTHAEQRLKLLLATDEGLPAWELFDGGQTVGGFRRITRGGSLRTRVDYDGPIDVTFTARTDSLNIRLTAYDRDMVIWNWELNPSELRVGRPDGSTVPAPVTPLEPNRWYTFHYRVTRQGTTITVDGVPVFSENQVYGKFPRAAVGVTGWGNAVVDVKKFVIRPLE